AADSLVQFLGGRGYVESNLAPQRLRDARVLRIFEGPTETLNMFLGSRIVGCFTQRRKDAKSKGTENNFVEFIADTFNAAGVCEQLFEAVRNIDRRFEVNPVFGKSIDNKRWVYSLVGEVATYAVLLAASKYSNSLNSTTEIKRAMRPRVDARRKGMLIKKAIAWLELEFQQKIDNALTVTPDELVTETADITSGLIDSYKEAIGDIQQNLVGEDGELDELLCRGDEHLSTLELKRSLEKFNHRPPSPPIMGGGRKLSPTILSKNQSIQSWLSQRLSNKLQIPLEKIDRSLSFADYGIDSVMAVELAQDLEEWLPDDLEIEPTLAWNFPSIEALAGYLASQESGETRQALS
ncbi:MAG: phosphopantetheine-binding protein, partial [Pleurocapsa sp.]